MTANPTEDEVVSVLPSTTTPEDKLPSIDGLTDAARALKYSAEAAVQQFDALVPFSTEEIVRIRRELKALETRAEQAFEASQSWVEIILASPVLAKAYVRKVYDCLEYLNQDLRDAWTDLETIDEKLETRNRNVAPQPSSGQEILADFDYPDTQTPALWEKKTLSSLRTCEPIK